MTSQVQSRRNLPRLRKSESLSAILSQGGPLPEEQVWSVIDQLLRYLETAHEQGKCHRCFSLSAIGIDASGELEIASTESPLSISDLVRLHVPLPSCLRHEFDLVLPAGVNDASIAMAHAGFGGNAEALDLYQIAVLTIRLVFDVDAERFLASPCSQETLPFDLCQLLKTILAADRQMHVTARELRLCLPGVESAVVESATCKAGLEGSQLLLENSGSKEVESSVPTATNTITESISQTLAVIDEAVGQLHEPLVDATSGHMEPITPAEHLGQGELSQISSALPLRAWAAVGVVCALVIIALASVLVLGGWLSN